MASLKLITKAKGDSPDLNLVFVHGLGDDSISAWSSDKKKTKTFWPRWLAKEYPNIRIWTLDYDASKTEWLRDVSSISKQARTILQVFLNEHFDKFPLAFVAHSFGGILINYLLRVARTQKIIDFTTTMSNFAGAVYLSTPHNGSKIANWVSYIEETLRVLKLSSHIEILKEGSDFLSDLTEFMQNEFDGSQSILFKSLYEQNPLPIEVCNLLKIAKLQVVDRESAKLGITGTTPIEVDNTDHRTICKPISKKNDVYKSTSRFIEDILALRKAEVVDDTPADDSASVQSTSKEDATVVRKKRDKHKILILDPLGQWGKGIKSLFIAANGKWRSTSFEYDIVYWEFDESGSIPEIKKNRLDGQGLSSQYTHIKTSEFRSIRYGEDRSYDPDDWLFLYILPITLASFALNLQQMHVLGPAFGTQDDVYVWTRPGDITLDSDDVLRLGVVLEGITTTVMLKILLSLNDPVFHPRPSKNLDTNLFDNNLETVPQILAQVRFDLLNANEDTSLGSPLHASVFTSTEYNDYIAYKRASSLRLRRVLNIDSPIAHFLGVDVMPRAAYAIHSSQASHVEALAQFLEWLDESLGSIDLNLLSQLPLRPDDRDFRKAQQEFIAIGKAKEFLNKNFGLIEYYDV